MKKFFRMLLLAAVALMPVMGMAQDSINVSQEQWERQMRSQQYADSVKAANRQAEFEHERLMVQEKSSSRQRVINAIFNEDIILLFVLAGSVITIVILCLRNSRKKAEDHKELINKLIEKDLLNSTETISKETIEALMNPKPKKSEKERFIGDATMLGLGIGLILAGEGRDADIVEVATYAGLILCGLGLLRLIIRTISVTIGYIINKKKESKIEIEEAEFVEEK